jgi:hypothetical protein
LMLCLVVARVRAMIGSTELSMDVDNGALPRGGYTRT